MKVLISAAETSSDIHGAQLLRALRARVPDLSAFGIGGPHLEAAGLRTVVHARSLLVMGFSEVLGRLPKVLASLRLLVRTAEQEKPDIAVVIDYPDFHFRLARRLQRLNIPVVYYIPPKVWVWRKKRMRVLQNLFAKVLCVFPFEEDIYRKAGFRATYVGNPLVEELPFGLTQSEARRQFDLGEQEKVLVLMTGSRPSEFAKHIEPMLEAALIVANRIQKKLRVLMPIPLTATVAPEWKQLITSVCERAAGKMDVQMITGKSAEALVAADAALVKSGTSTLEAALLGCPHAVIYKTPQLTAWIFKYLIRYRGPVGLVNLIGGWVPGGGPEDCKRIAREILCDQVTPQNLADEAFSLLMDEDRRQAMKKNFAEIRLQLEAGNGCDPASQLKPSERAATEILEVKRP